MANRMKHTFVLLTLVVLALAHSSRADDSHVPVSATQATPSSTPAVPEAAHAQHPAESVKAATTAAATVNATNGTAKPVKLEVFYEALCSDSVNFVQNQLSPVYDKLNKFLNVTFIPFGQGNITKLDNGTYTLECHRAKECEADQVHACAIEHIKETDKLLKFVNCSLVEGFLLKTIPIEKCATYSNLDKTVVDSIQLCLKNNASFELLEHYMEVSRANKVKSVPKIVFNQNYSEDTEKLALTNLLQTVCTLIPPADSPAECKNIVSGSSAVVVGILPLLISVYYLIRMF